MNILKEYTKSICPTCFQEIPAKVYEKDDKVYMSRNCSQHGEFNFLIEKDAWIYKKLMNKDTLKQRRPFDNVMIAVTHSCNLNCPSCYLPNRNTPDLTLEEIKKVISNFDGRKIRLSGGEPTFREDLPQIIRFTCEQGKLPLLITNGLKLADRDYVKELKKAGLQYVCLSFNSFTDKAYKELNGCSLLKIKLKALSNLKRENMDVRLSVMLKRGVNEKELKKIYHFCVRNSHFIGVLRIRRAVSIDRLSGNNNENWFYLSEMIAMISKIIGVSKKDLVEHSLSFTPTSYLKDHAPCSLNIRLIGLLLKVSGIDKIKKPLLRNLKLFFNLLPRIGLKGFFAMLIRKLRGEKEVLKLKIFIRQCVYLDSVDLEEMNRCPSAHFVGETEEIVPLCYGIMLNDKTFLL